MALMLCLSKLSPQVRSYQAHAHEQVIWGGLLEYRFLSPAGRYSCHRSKSRMGSPQQIPRQLILKAHVEKLYPKWRITISLYQITMQLRKFKESSKHQERRPRLQLRMARGVTFSESPEEPGISPPHKYLKDPMGCLLLTNTPERPNQPEILGNQYSF